MRFLSKTATQKSGVKRVLFGKKVSKNTFLFVIIAAGNKNLSKT